MSAEACEPLLKGLRVLGDRRGPAADCHAVMKVVGEHQHRDLTPAGLPADSGAGRQGRVFRKIDFVDLLKDRGALCMIAQELSQDSHLHAGG
jgi:hypothetical protein